MILDASAGSLPTRALVTGASGFVGGRLREALHEAGVDVISLVRPGSPEPELGRALRTRYDDAAALEAFMRDEAPEVIFHCAGVTKGVRYTDFHGGNVAPTTQLLAAVREAHPGLKRFVHVSTLAAFGPNNDGPPRRESDPPRPLEHYGRSKLEAEDVVQNQSVDVPWTIIRPCAVYGPRDVDFLNLFQGARRGIKLYYGNRDKRASVVYVDDLVRGMVAASDHEATRGRGYFICDGQPRTWGEITEEIVRTVGKRAFTISVPAFTVKAAAIAGEALSALDHKPRLLNRQKAQLDAQQAWECTHEQARQDFGYGPDVELAEGLARTHRWYREQRWL